MVRLCAGLLLAFCAWAQKAPFTIEQVLGSAFPTHLTAAPTGGKVAWVTNARGVINIMVAEPPAYAARQITRYTQDDGQDIVELHCTPDGREILYVRGEAANRAREFPNPALNVRGAEQAIWIAALDAASSSKDGPRKLADGNSVVVSPRGGRFAYISNGRLCWASLDDRSEAHHSLQTRGQAKAPGWSPDGSRIAFVSDRGDHTFIGVFNVGDDSLRYL